MAETSGRERKKLFVEIMKSFKEYSNENIADPETIKAEIVELLQSHRAVKIVDWEYGLSFTFKKSKIIIKEKEDPSKAREYANYANLWQCTNRTSQSKKCYSSDLIMKYGICFAPLNHCSVCETRDYSFVMEVQELLKQKKVKEARSFIGKQKFTSNQSLSASMINDSTLSTTTTDMENESILEQSISHDTTVSIDSNTTAPSQQPPETENVPEDSAKTVVKKETAEADDCTVLEPPAKRPKIETIDDEVYFFDHPSASVLKRMCEKLKIEYNHDAYKLWGDIVFDKIVPDSDNVKRHELKSSNIFACFSLFFTGNIKSIFLIQNTLNSAFYEKLIDSGTIPRFEADEMFINHTVSKEKLEFIANFLSCRIGIYEGGKLKKYGKWETENNALTLVLLFAYGMYSVVLDC